MLNNPSILARQKLCLHFYHSTKLGNVLGMKSSFGAAGSRCAARQITLICLCGIFYCRVIALDFSGMDFAKKRLQV